jgi:hypothetical protein
MPETGKHTKVSIVAQHSRRTARLDAQARRPARVHHPTRAVPNTRSGAATSTDVTRPTDPDRRLRARPNPGHNATEVGRCVRRRSGTAVRAPAVARWRSTIADSVAPLSDCSPSFCLRLLAAIDRRPGLVRGGISPDAVADPGVPQSRIRPSAAIRWPWHRRHDPGRLNALGSCCRAVGQYQPLTRFGLGDQRVGRRRPLRDGGVLR